MGAGTDLGEKAELFQISLFLKNASGVLEKLSKGKSLANEEQERLMWASKLLGAADWDSPHYKKRQGEFPNVMATAIRPYFDGAITEGMVLKDFSFSDEEDKRRFLEGFYQTLASGGQQIALSGEEIETARKITPKTADKVFSYLQNRGGRGSGLAA